MGNFDLSASAIEVLRRAELEASAAQSAHITTLHVLLALMKYPKGPWNMLVIRGITPQVVINKTTRVVDEQPSPEHVHGIALPLSTVMESVLRRASVKKQGATITPITMLAGLLDEAESDAIQRLTQLKFPLDTLRTYFRKHLQPSLPAAPPAVPGRRGYRFSRRSRLVIERASQAAAEQGQSDYSSAYLLYGLAATPGSICSALLHEHGVAAKTLRTVIGEVTHENASVIDGTDGYALMSPEVHMLLPFFKEAALLYKAEKIEPEHILLTLLRRKTIANDLLVALQLDPDTLIDDLVRSLNF